MNQANPTVSNPSSSPTWNSVLSIPAAIGWGGLVIGVLDALDAIVAYKVFAGFDPIPIYQYVASGLLGKDAFSGGLGTAGLGVAVHMLIAYSAAAVYILAAQRWPALVRNWAATGALYGATVFLGMTYGLIPLTRIAPSPFSLPLFVNGILGHALFVGLPAAYFAQRTRADR